MRKLFEGAIAAALIAVVPATASAQEQEQGCVAELNVVQVGQIAEVWATFPTPFGEVTALRVPEESGLILASGEDVEKVQMSSEAETPEKEALAKLDTTTIFWVDTREAAAGTYEIALEGEGGSCSASITVEQPS